MNRNELVQMIRSKKSCLCVGLDTDADRLPISYSSGPEEMLRFNLQMIEATQDLCVAYKMNTAFYERWGSRGWSALEETIRAIEDSHFIIADAKRGDIGNTAHQYAKAFFDHLGADALTVNPYMGMDTLSPYLEYEGKWTIVLGSTSNAGARDVQQLQLENSTRVYEEVILKASKIASEDQLMFVAGATRPEDLKRMRELTPDHFYLVPGVGAQGGSVEEVLNAAGTGEIGLLINASRSVIFASSDADYASAARDAAFQLQQQMVDFIRENS